MQYNIHYRILCEYLGTQIREWGRWGEICSERSRDVPGTSIKHPIMYCILPISTLQCNMSINSVVTVCIVCRTRRQAQQQQQHREKSVFVIGPVPLFCINSSDARLHLSRRGKRHGKGCMWRQCYSVVVVTDINLLTKFFWHFSGPFCGSSLVHDWRYFTILLRKFTCHARGRILNLNYAYIIRAFL